MAEGEKENITKVKEAISEVLSSAENKQLDYSTFWNFVHQK